MKLGTIMIHNRMYDLDNLEKDELEKLLGNNTTEKNLEFETAKKICKRDSIQNNYSVDDIPDLFKDFIDNSASFVKSDAIIQRALIQKSTYDIITKKVKNIRNNIIANSKRICPKVLNNSKYSNVQADIEKYIKNYENVLYKLADYYDNKIEEIILNKVELNANIVGSIVKDEYLIEEKDKGKEAKEKDKLLLSLSNSVKNYIQKFTLKKSEKKIVDVTMISNLEDKAELEEEQKDILNSSYENTKKMQQDNLNLIIDFENQLNSIDKEIIDLNIIKIDELKNAIESDQSEMIISQKQNNILKKIKLFLESKINPIKVIYNTIINPSNELLKKYENIIDEKIKE